MSPDLSVPPIEIEVPSIAANRRYSLRNVRCRSHFDTGVNLLILIAACTRTLSKSILNTCLLSDRVTKRSRCDWVF